MKKRMFATVLILFFLVPMLALPVSADMGPKPGTVIQVRGVEEPIVMTLLAETEGNGPHSTIGPEEKAQDWMVRNENQAEGWYAFRDYQDPDGFHFWGEVWEDGVKWGFYPPEVFKIAVYYPELDLLWVSEDIYERYAFRSDYTLVLPAPGVGAQSGEVDMVLKKDASIPVELGALALRILLTITIELSVAKLFGLDSRKQRQLILMTNLVTQVGLNGLLWGWYYFDGPLAAMLRLILLELVVLVVESIVYLRRLREDEGAVRIVGYALCANLMSVLLGFLLLT